MVSPDDWDEQFEKEYQSWKGKTLSSSNKTIVTKADFRQPIIDINEEFDLEEAYAQIEAGVSAIDKLIAYRK